jgi:predicted Rossmann fold flavoprotein
MKQSIAIIGGGASALFAAINLAKRDFNVVVFEKNQKVGKKLLATGNGKCNITNKNLSLENFFSTNLQFIKYPIETFGFKEFLKFCDLIGLNLIVKENGKTYPASLQASSVVDILYYEALHLGVLFHFNSFIKEINFNQKWEVLEGEKILKFDKIIIATGSKAMEKLGSSDSGYGIAKKFGHNIIKPIPSLVQLTSKNSEIFSLSGVKAEADVTIFINNKAVKKVSGDLLFTNYGLSGNTILDLSREANMALDDGFGVDILIDIFPKLDKNKLIALLESKAKVLKDRDISFLLLSFINSKMIDFVLKKSKIATNKQKISQLDKKDILNIAYTLKSIKVNIDGSKGFEHGEVVAGGVCVSEVDSKTMESKKQKGLYFCGEVLDVDGACGGYNLHWAWASAFILATNMK